MKASLILRIVYAVCLAGATCTHVALHLEYGMLLEGLDGHGVPPGSRYYWSALTLLDPLAALLMFFRPRAGLALAGGIIVSDVAHNTWILQHLHITFDARYWAQVAFLVFLFATFRFAWRGVPPNPESR